MRLAGQKAFNKQTNNIVSVGWCRISLTQGNHVNVKQEEGKESKKVGAQLLNSSDMKIIVYV